MNKSGGFSLVQVMLALVMVGIISGTGWYVYSSSKNASNSLKNAENTTSSQPESQNNSIPQGYKKYENTTLGFSFIYPENWKLSEFSNVSDIEILSVATVSPDYEAQRTETTTYSKNGGRFLVLVYKDSSKDFESFSSSLGYWVEPKQRIKIDGFDAVKSQCGHWQTYLCLAVLRNAQRYEFLYEQPIWHTKPSLGIQTSTPKDKYQPEFDKLIESINFN